MTMKEIIRQTLENVLPLVDLDSDFLFQELDSLGITTILMTLSDMYGIELNHSDVTPKNFSPHCSHSLCNSLISNIRIF